MTNPTTNPTCACGRTMHKAGTMWSGRHKIQRYRCQGCGATKNGEKIAVPATKE